MAVWQVQQAKSRLSELLDNAEREGAQIITRHGAERAVVLSIADYRALSKPEADFKDWLLNGPKIEEIDITRSRDTGRDIEL